MATANGAGDDEFHLLESAVQRAIDLRAAVEDLPDPLLRELVDVILLELGKRVVVLD